MTVWNLCNKMNIYDAGLSWYWKTTRSRFFPVLLETKSSSFHFANPKCWRPQWRTSFPNSSFSYFTARSRVTREAKLHNLISVEPDYAMPTLHSTLQELSHKLVIPKVGSRLGQLKNIEGYLPMNNNRYSGMQVSLNKWFWLTSTCLQLQLQKIRLSNITSMKICDLEEMS